ncbi:MAG: hypothetical protein WCA54_16135 [Pseudolabrys sp.]
MRKALSIIVVAAVVGFGLQIIGGPTETIAAKEMASIPFQKGVSVHGLRVALPESMTNFPKELVPLP